MESYKIDFTASARQDLRDTYTYIKKPSVAENFYARLEKSIETLSTLLKRHAVVREEKLAEKGYRILPLGNYLIFYSVDDASKTVTVYRILYSLRDWMSLL